MRFATCCLLIVFSLAAGLTAAEPFDASRLQVTVLDTGLNRPMELEVAPDGRIFYVELDGQMKIYHPDTRQTTVAADFKVFTPQENGLLGLALDPNFAKTQWVYIHYSPTDYDGQYISRFTMKGDTLDFGSELLLLQFNEQRKECCHHAGSIEFGPDGCLYIGAGDNTNPFGDSGGYAPIDQRPDRSPWDAEGSAGNTNDLRGKILRIRPMPDGTAEIPDGNLFPKDGSKGRPEIYVMGCRNPWRINVDQKTGYLYWGEVGPDAGSDNDKRGPRGYDEVNQAREAGNFGWPFFVGNNYAYHRWNFATNESGEAFDPAKPINESPNNTGAKELPPAHPAFIWYPGGSSPDFPMLQTGGRTACAGPVYHFDPNLKSETKLPDHFDNCLFIYEWSRHWVMAVHLDADSHIKEIEPFMPDYKFVRPIDLTFGPDGSLYALEYGTTWGKNDNARMIRVDYIRGNRTPVAKATIENNVGKQPLTVKVSAEGSSDRDGDQLTYQWFRQDTGKVIDGKDATMTFEKPGAFNVQLMVKDTHGAVGIASAAVLVGNARPKVAFEYPQDGDFFEWEKPIAYKVKVSDEEDGDGAAAVALSGRYESGKADNDDEPLALKMMRHSDCFNCHAVDRKIVGPPFIEVARKYRNDAAGQQTAAVHILGGSSGVWGTVVMLPHPQHSLDETTQMVKWILTLADQHGDAIDKAEHAGEFTIGKKPKDAVGGAYTLTASYTDKGYGAVGPLAGSTEIKLRPAQLEVESADAYDKMKLGGVGDGGPGQQKFGSIESGAWARFNHVSLKGITRVTCRVASGNTGGTISFRKGGVDGEVLGTAEVPSGKDWGKYFDVAGAIKDPGERFDLFVTFTREGGGGGLMDINWIHFHADDAAQKVSKR
ncbi:MAG: carbohydrate-binding protein [Phycisphaera sp.]|nr:carbohydrate-binding protein [Phycisphaera sp.]